MKMAIYFALGYLGLALSFAALVLYLMRHTEWDH